MRTKISKQEQALREMRAFDIESAKTEAQIYSHSIRHDRSKERNELFEKVKALNPQVQEHTKQYNEFIDLVFRILPAATESRSIHSGNLKRIEERSRYIRRFKSGKVWRYYLLSHDGADY